MAVAEQPPALLVVVALVGHQVVEEVLVEQGPRAARVARAPVAKSEFTPIFEKKSFCKNQILHPILHGTK